MAYTPSYSTGDFKAIIVDGMGTAGASAVSWIDTFMILLVLLLVLGIFVRIGKVFKK
jgi:hypothetical protein